MWEHQATAAISAPPHNSFFPHLSGPHLTGPATSPLNSYVCRRQVRPAGRLPHLPGNFPHPLFVGLRERPTATRPGRCSGTSRPCLGQRHPRCCRRRRSARVELRRRRCCCGGGGAVGGGGAASECDGDGGLRSSNSRDRHGSCTMPHTCSISASTILLSNRGLLRAVSKATLAAASISTSRAAGWRAGRVKSRVLASVKSRRVVRRRGKVRTAEV